MSFPPAFLDELRARLSLSSLIGRRIKLVRAGREYKACCPFHHEKTPSFYVNDEKQFYHCFGCGAHGDIIGFTMRYDNLSFLEAIESLAAQAGLEVPAETPESRERFDRDKQLYHLLDRATSWFEAQLRAPAGQAARAYLANRGLGGDAIARHHIGYAPNDSHALVAALTKDGFKLDELVAIGLAKKSERHGEPFGFFRNRVIFPVGDARGRTVAFGGRVMDGGEPKYLNSPDHPLFHKGRLLYGLSRARAALTTGQPLIVVEGYMDVIALAEAGFSGAVAPLGTALTPEHLGLLWHLLPAPEVRDPGRDYSPILCFDGDGAGLRAAARGVDRALPYLTAAQTVRVATLPEGEDPDSLIKKEGRGAMQAVLDAARPMIDMLWLLTAENRRLQTPEERAGFAAALQQKIAQIGDSSLRALYKDEIQKRLSETFAWRTDSRDGGTGFSGPTRRSLFKRQPLRRTLAHKPESARQRMEKIIITLMVNHPSLFADYGEDLAQLTLTRPSLEALRQQVVTILSSDSHESLDAAELYRHLSQGEGDRPWRQGLAEALTEETYVHAGFARPGKTLDEAKRGWQSIWKAHLRESLHAELEAAKGRWASDATDDNLARVEALRLQLAALAESPLEEKAPRFAADDAGTGSPPFAARH